MATNAIISSSNLDVSKISFGDIRANKAGGKSVPIKYNGQSLQIRLEKATYPMGVNVRVSENGTNYTLSLTLKGCDPFAKERATGESGTVGTLYNFLQDLQSRLLDTAEANSVKWFGKSRSRSVLEDTMKQFISPSVEKVNGEWVPTGKYPPSLKMKVPVYDGRVAMDVTDSQGKPVAVDVDNITNVFPKRVEASIVVSPGVYVSGQGWGEFNDLAFGVDPVVSFFAHRYISLLWPWLAVGWYCLLHAGDEFLDVCTGRSHYSFVSVGTSHRQFELEFAHKGVDRVIVTAAARVVQARP
jgi:hypothetical protein